MTSHTLTNPPKLAYLPRILVMATLPHSKPSCDTFTRVNGAYHLTLLADPRFGLPYGARSRLLLAWLCTQAVQTRSHRIELPSLTQFVKLFEDSASGGKTGNLTYLTEHLRRLVTSTIRFSFQTPRYTDAGGFCVSRHLQLWEPPVEDASRALGTSKVHLSLDFFEELLAHPIPLQRSALSSLRKSPMALDLYAWLTYRFFTLTHPVTLTWPALRRQFGADYTHIRQFRYAFRRELKRVQATYPQARLIDRGQRGIELFPSPTHVSSRG